eukprot:scaffold98418_cov69-Phaeocystis_antarctica.AAC.2
MQVSCAAKAARAPPREWPVKYNGRLGARATHAATRSAADRCHTWSIAPCTPAEPQLPLAVAWRFGMAVLILRSNTEASTRKSLVDNEPRKAKISPRSAEVALITQKCAPAAVEV